MRTGAMRAVLCAPVLAIALLSSRAAAEPQAEIVREEAFNYRIVGALPRGWTRTPDKLIFTYSVDGIPLAYVHFARERIAGEVDVAAELERRAPHYRFPGAPKEPPKDSTERIELIEPVRWGDRDAFLYTHDLTIGGVACRRIVRAVVYDGVWYECIETLHGEPPPPVLAGLACFRNGFLLLTQRLAQEELGTPAARRINDAVYGFRIEKPEGYTREQANPGADPGCRLAMLRRGPQPGQQLSIRLFEYGVRKNYDPARWLDLLDQAFRRSHVKASREPAQAPDVEGAVRKDGIRLRGQEDDQEVVTTVYLWQARSERVYGLRIVSHADAEKSHAASLASLIGSLAFTGQER